MARQLEAHSETGRAQAEALMERHFAALDQRIAALHDLARGRNVEGIRDDLATLGDRIDGLATNGESVSGSLSLVREQLDELRNRLESEGWNGATALTGMQDRLELITDKLAQLELTPSALSAVERGYSHILERVSRIEQLSGQNVAADDLWERLDELRDQIGTMGSGGGIASLEARIAGLAENIEHLSASRGHDPAFDRVELKLADMARTIAIIRDRRDMHSGAVEARLADITARIDKFGQERGRIDFTPVERQIASLSSRIDQIGNRAPDVDLAAMERQFAELGGRIEEMLKRPAQGVEDRPAFDNIESRLGELQSRLEDVYAAADRSPATADPSEALGNIDKRLVELHGRLDDLTIASGVEPSELTPIATRLDAIDDRLKAVSENASSSMSVELATLSDKMNLIDEHLRTMAPSNPDLPILLGRLEDIESQVRSAAAKTAAVDLSPLTSQLSAIERQLSESAPAGEVDLRPVDARLQGIEGRLEDLMISMPADSRSLADRLEAIDRRFDQLSGGSPDLSPLNDQLVEIDRQLRGLTAFGTAAALDWSPITDRLDDLNGRLSDYQPGQAPDLSGLQETLATIDERLDRLSAGGSPASGAAGMNLASENIAPLTERLQAIEAHLSTLASGAPEAQGSISPVAERLQAIEQRLETMQAGGIGPVGDDDGRMVPLLETIEAALRKISTSDDIAALNEKVGGLHAALDNAGEGSALEDMADLRNDITYLRRELRSMPMMAEAEDGSGGLGTLLAEIKDRLDRIPDGQNLGGG
ncbi:MAG TPA: hypothetical protein VKN63_07880, partial [Afifellaceae bacterium]|nr:hypothetical protein [Afifellaceae bacterium]